MKPGSITDLIQRTYRPEEYPALYDQLQRWQRTRPLSGLRILDATPVYRNTLVKHLALLASGAELAVGVSEMIGHDPAIVNLLRNEGIPVCHAQTQQEAPFDLILDCAGAFADRQPAIGFVELTRSGVARYGDCPKPVYVADSGRIKRIETMLGTGESYFRAMAQHGYDRWQGRKLVIFGSGKVGSGLILYAHRLGARVSVVTEPASLTPAFNEYIHEVIDYRNRVAVGTAVRSAYAVVTATGHRNVFQACCPPQDWQASTALLANMGVEDEFGESIPAERVLNRKETLNFTLEEPTHLKYIDATMALHNAGALYLVNHPEARGLLTPDPETEEQLLRISRLQGTIAEELSAIV